MLAFIEKLIEENQKIQNHTYEKFTKDMFLPSTKMSKGEDRPIPLMFDQSSNEFE